jgi:hypothetical protein
LESDFQSEGATETLAEGELFARVGREMTPMLSGVAPLPTRSGRLVAARISLISAIGAASPMR